MIVAVLLLAGIRTISRKLSQPFSYRHLLRLGYALSAAVVLLPLFSTLFGHQSLVPHAAQVWSASTMQGQPLAELSEHRTIVSLASTRASLSLNTTARIAGFGFASGLLVILVRAALDAAAILRIIVNAQRIRRCGDLSILACNTTSVPFSFWFPGRYFIVVPAALVLRPNDLRMAIRHEAQHHRQIDTRILYLYSLARGLFHWNPAAHLLARQILELQEFACDEAVIRRRPESANEYCRCLLWVAEAALRGQSRVLQSSMAGGNRSVLRRRIETVLVRPDAHLPARKAAVSATVAVAVLAAVSVAFATPVRDHRISMAEAQRLAAMAPSPSAFPLIVNERVLEQLNVLLGTPDGRAFLRAGLARMGPYRSSISAQLKRYGLPPELMAVPLAESGYRNLPPSDNPRHGAGLWMFIESTARRWGLEITDNRDDRLNVSGETEAALRMLSSLQLRFNDWSLALLAYNAGETRVEQGLRETGSKDAWHLIDRGYENDPNYLPRTMAVVLILKNPALVD
jgi:beta-lactamase regulating signal transducer with metallopeptidase domain